MTISPQLGYEFNREIEERVTVLEESPGNGGSALETQPLVSGQPTINLTGEFWNKRYPISPALLGGTTVNIDNTQDPPSGSLLAINRANIIGNSANITLSGFNSTNNKLLGSTGSSSIVLNSGSANDGGFVELEYLDAVTGWIIVGSRAITVNAP